MVFDSTVLFVAHCEELLAQPVGEDTALQWASTIPPVNWFNSLQAVRLIDRLNDRYREEVTKLYLGEAAIADAEWRERYAEDAYEWGY